MRVWFVLVGGAGFLASGLLTRWYFRRRTGLPIEQLNRYAGTGIVPAWVSRLYFVSLAVLAVGVITVVVGWII